jgi:hypothetical protein
VDGSSCVPEFLILFRRAQEAAKKMQLIDSTNLRRVIISWWK